MAINEQKSKKAASLEEEAQELLLYEKIDKQQFAEHVLQFYIRNKLLLITEEQMGQGYLFMGEINAAIAEECLAAENEAFEITQQNLKKGTDDASDGKAWGNLLC